MHIFFPSWQSVVPGGGRRPGLYLEFARRPRPLALKFTPVLIATLNEDRLQRGEGERVGVL